MSFINNKLFCALLFIAGIIPCARAELYLLEWDKLERFAGDGENTAALVIQFDSTVADFEDYIASPVAYAWGYRFTGTVSAEQMIRDIASASHDLDVMLQNTGELGYTFCGAAFSYEHEALDMIEYDFDGARNDGKVSFQWFGEGRPGYDTPQICTDAIDEARKTHIIEHPLNYPAYGYPAYDYDHWGCEDFRMFAYQDLYWQSGWYDGFWSLWHGGENLRRLSFSGVGISSLPVQDSTVIALCFNLLQRNEDVTEGAIPRTSLYKAIDYHHFDFDSDDDNITDIITSPVSPDCDLPKEYYDISGRPCNPNRKGLYIVKQGSNYYKILIRDNE